MERFDVVVIGQGYAGLTAAKLANERGLRTANIEAECMGGLILNLNELYPPPAGFAESGAEIASNLAMANMESGVTCLSEAVTSVERGEDGCWVIHTDDQSYSARHVVAASGAKLKKLGVPGEAEYYGLGVSECVDCDGPLYKDMETVIVGGGDSAFQEALALSHYASKVTVAIRGDKPRAKSDFQDRVAAEPKIKLLFNTQVTEVAGAPGKGVSAVKIQSAELGEQTLPCQGVFVYVGLEPNTAFLPGDLTRDDRGALVAGPHGKTESEGIWAIGAVRAGFGGTLDDAANDAKHAIEAIA